MSSGTFTATTYDLDAGGGLSCRIQSETITSWNPAGTATKVNGVGRIRLSTGRREFGVSPRAISGIWITPPAGYKAGGTVRVPIFAPASFNAIALDATLAYLGGDIRVTGKIPQKVS